MLKKFAVLCLTLLLCVFGVSASDSMLDNGQVIYHQSFENGMTARGCGISVGEIGSQTPILSMSDDGLSIQTCDKERTYILFPNVVSSGSRTIEFSFRFDEKTSDNARLAFILTCRGSEPTNVTSVVFRAGGTVDDFSELSDDIKNAVRNGEMINVKIPLESGVLHEVILSTDDEVCTIENREVSMIAEGKNGLVVRNADVTVDDIYVVNGVGYGEKNGYFAKASYSDDYTPTEIIENVTDTNVELSPQTGDMLLLWPILMFAAGFGLGYFIIKKKR